MDFKPFYKRTKKSNCVFKINNLISTISFKYIKFEILVNSSKLLI